MLIILLYFYRASANSKGLYKTESSQSSSSFVSLGNTGVGRVVTCCSQSAVAFGGFVGTVLPLAACIVLDEPCVTCLLKSSNSASYRARNTSQQHQPNSWCLFRKHVTPKRCQLRHYNHKSTLFILGTTLLHWLCQVLAAAAHSNTNRKPFMRNTEPLG